MADLEMVEGTEQVPEPQVQPQNETTSEEVGVETEVEGAEPSGEPSEKGGVQRRIDELTRKRREAEERAIYLQGQVDMMRAGMNVPQPTGDTPSLKKISRDQFDNDEEYEAAVVERAASTAVSRVKRELQAEKAVEAKTRMLEPLEKEGLLEKAQEVGAQADEIMLIAAGDEKVEVVKAWIADPAESRRILALPPFERAAAVGELRARLRAGPKPKTTKTPIPPKTISSGGSPPTKNLEDMTASEKVRHWEAERLNRLRGQKGS